MQVYPLTSPIILNDGIFNDFGGRPGSSSPKQRSYAYMMSEEQCSTYIGTLLLPVIVTGTYNYANSQRIATDYGYVSRILGVNILSQNYLSNSCDLVSNPGCAYIQDDTFGYVDIHQTLGACGLALYMSPASLLPYYPPYRGTMYQFQIVYEAGLPTGTANLPGVLQALSIVAQINLNEMVGDGSAGINEGVGDIGIQDFRTLDYSERRTPLKHTALGNSAKSNRAAMLLDSSIRKARRTLMI